MGEVSDTAGGFAVLIFAPGQTDLLLGARAANTSKDGPLSVQGLHVPLSLELA